MSSGSHSVSGFGELKASIRPETLAELASEARQRAQTDGPFQCCVDDNPRCGSFNLVYTARFSDGLCWVVRVDAESSSLPHQTMRTDVEVQRFLCESTSIPIPRIYAWDDRADNPLGRPYMIADLIPGTELVKLWNEPGWLTETKRLRIFDQLARWMTELAALEFPLIGTPLHLASREVGPIIWTDGTPRPSGPFSSTLAYVATMISAEMRRSLDYWLPFIRLFALALIDETLEGPPFSLAHPDFDSQNVLVTDDGNVTGLIDWDGITTRPRQCGAAAYPAWLTVDWDPQMYAWNPDASDEQNAGYDSPEDLERYRSEYLAAIDRASEGRLTTATRDSHIISNLVDAVESPRIMPGVALKVAEHVFGSETAVSDALYALRTDGSWWRSLQASQQGVVSSLNTG